MCSIIFICFLYSYIYSFYKLINNLQFMKSLSVSGDGLISDDVCVRYGGHPQQAGGQRRSWRRRTSTLWGSRGWWYIRLLWEWSLQVMKVIAGMKDNFEIWVWPVSREKRDPKSVLTMASYACEWHHGWCMQTAWTITEVIGKLLPLYSFPKYISKYCLNHTSITPVPLFILASCFSLL